jgi:hypothetical protein
VDENGRSAYITLDGKPERKRIGIGGRVILQ